MIQYELGATINLNYTEVV